MIRGDSLSDVPGLRHAFFTREGGVSAGRYDSLNCGFGSDDSPEAVARNRALAMERLGLPAEALTTVYQVHGRDVAILDAVPEAGRGPRADAMVTNRPGLALGILTADCAPVLFADPDAEVIGAAHAGWRGAVGGVLDAVIETMVSLGANTGAIHAVVGPCIGATSYEVGPDFPAPFLAEAEENCLFFRPAPRKDHYLFDLGGYVTARLKGLGVGSVSHTGEDTYADDRFFSYRRTTHQGGGDYGRLLTAIALEP
ncbi:MAG: polyphenol oxidase [Rhodospirillaceae bacterium]|nr:polyphenol oxidase [Rhodospirillaceae bacterium]